MKEAPPAPAEEAKKTATASDLAKDKPSHAPPRPGETVQPATVGGVAAKQVPQKTEAMDKIASAERERSQGLIVTQSRDDRALKDQFVVKKCRVTDEITKSVPRGNG